MKRLITDRDLLAGTVTGPIVLDGSTILTPAARDRALRMGLAIVEAGASGPWHATAPSAAAEAPSAKAGCARCGNAACGGGCASCAGPALATGGGGSATLGALADGLYLVRVQGGRAVQVLPASGPGLLQRAGGG